MNRSLSFGFQAIVGAVIALILLANPTLATTYHLTPADNIVSVIDNLQAGDTVYLAGGTYNPTPFDPSFKDFSCWNLHGTATAWITIEPEPGQHPIINLGSPVMPHGFEFGNSQYVCIEGLELAGNPGNATAAIDYSGGSAQIAAMNNHMQVINCYFHDFGGSAWAGDGSQDLFEDNTVAHCCLNNNNHQSGINVGTPYLITPVDNTNFAGPNGNPGNLYSIIVRNNTVYGSMDQVTIINGAPNGPTDGDGIICDTFNFNGYNYPGRMLIANNVCYDNVGAGINIGDSSHIDVINNTCYHNAMLDNFCEICVAGNTNDINVVNNLCVPSLTNFDFAATSGNATSPAQTTFSNNLYFYDNNNHVVGTNDVVGKDPEFVNQLTGDFRTGSMAGFGKGLTSISINGTPITIGGDRDGVVRNGRNDIGAYQSIGPDGRRIALNSMLTGDYATSTGSPYYMLSAGAATTLGLSGIFDIYNAGSGNIGLNSELNGLFVSTNTGDANLLQATFDSMIGTPDIFTWLPQSGQTTALLSTNSNYYVVDNHANSDYLQATASSIGTPELFAWTDLGSYYPTPPIGHRIALTSVGSGHVVMNGGSPSYVLSAATASTPALPETFDVYSAGSGNVALFSESSGLFVSCNAGNAGTLQASSDSTIGSADIFTWVQQTGGTTALFNTYSASYVMDDNGNGDHLEASASGIGTWEKFAWIDLGPINTSPPPAAPMNLTATAGNAQVALSWTASQAGATSYNVYRGTVSNNESGTPVATGITTTSYTDTSVNNGTAYYYVVAGVNASGPSGSSNEATATPSSGPSPCISVNFVGNGSALTSAQSAGVVASPNWNNPTGATGSGLSLLTNTGAASGASVSWSAPSTWYLGITGTSGDATMMNGYLDTTGSGTVTATISGLPSDYTTNGYTVYVYTNGSNGTATRTSSWSVGSTPVSITDLPNAVFNGTYTQGNNSNGNYVVFGSQTAGSFTITGTPGAASDGNPRCPLNGIQIVETSNPPPAPGSPAALMATPGNAQVALSWTASSGATSYKLYRGTAPGGENATPIATGITATTYTNTGVTNGVTYYYTVAAANAGGTSSYSNEAGATPQVPAPAAPTGLTATAGNAQITLSWSTSSGATSYNLYRGTTTGGEGTVPYASGLTGASVTDTNVTNGITYYYKVAAVNAGGKSGYSNEANATASVTTPSTPTGLTAAGGPTQIALSWTSSSGAVTYNIYRGMTAGGESSTAVATGVTSTTYTNTGLTAGTQYYYKVAAVNAVGTSGYSNEASATPLVSAPAPPTGLIATTANSQIALFWTASSGATSYNVYRGITSGGESSTPISTGITSASYTDTSVVNGTSYYYKVAAVNAGGTSGYSNQASATPYSGPAPVISIDFVGNGSAMTSTQTAGVVAYPNWNNASGASGSGLALVNGSGTSTGASASWAASSTWYLAISGSSGDYTMMNGYLDTPATGSTASTTISGLPADFATNGYTVYVYTDGQNGSATRSSSWSIGSTTISITSLPNTTFSGTYTQGNNGNGNYVVFNNQTGSSFTVTGTPGAASDGAQRAPLNGIQIVENGGSGGGSAPAAPTALTATAGNAQVALSWTASSGATSYNVYRGVTAGGESGTAIATGITTTAYTNTGLTNGTQYYFTVKAVNAGGTSAASNEASATPQVAAPTAPTGLTATAGNAQVALSWTASSGATSYNVYRGVTPGGESGTAIATGITTTTYTNTGLTNGTLYYFTVKAVNAGGTSPASNEASATPQVPAPSAPTGLVATAGNAQVALSWTASSGATSYNIYRGVTAGGESGTAIATGITTTTYTNTGLINGTLFYFTVKAVNPGGTSGASNEASATPQVAAPSAPTGLTATAGNAQVALSWTASSGATSYNLYRGNTPGGESGTAIATGITTTTYTNSSLTNGTAYYYKVAAVNAGGTSGYSNEASATPFSGPAPVISIDFVGSGSAMTSSQSAGVVASLNWNNASGASGSGLALLNSGGASTGASASWTAPGTWYLGISGSTGDYVMMNGYLDTAPSSTSTASVTISGLPSDYTTNGYTVYVYTMGQNGTATRSSSWSIGGTSIGITDLANSTFTGTYTQGNNGNGNYVVFNNQTGSSFTVTGTPGAASDGNERAPLNGIQIVENGSGSSAPAAPTGLTAMAGSSQVALSWSASSGATSYNVYKGTGSGSESTTPIASGITSTNYTDTSVTNGTLYYYRVAAVNTGGTSGYSNEVSAAPFLGSAPVISISFVGTGSSLMSTQSAGAVASVNWNNASGATGSGLALVNNTGASTGATASWTAPGTWVLGIGGSTGDYIMMNGYLDTSPSSTSTASVTITGLPSGYTTNGYTVYVYTIGQNGTATRASSWSIGGTAIGITDLGSSTFTGTYTQGNNGNGNYVVFNNQTGSSFTVTGTPGAASDGNERAPLNGIQIVEN